MLVKTVSTGVVDVFVGNGWQHWTRFEIKGRAFRKLGGASLSPTDLLKWKGYLRG
jgi:hypothetical protein